MIRAATDSDIPRIAEIHTDAWIEAYSDIISPEVMGSVTVEARAHTWTKWFQDTEQDLHVLERNNIIVGFNRVAPSHESSSELTTYGELTHIYQDPAHIGSGVGNELFEHATQFIERSGRSGMFLWTLEKNRRARRFYERHGMTADGPRKDEPDWLGEGVYEVRYILPFDSRDSLERP